MSTEQKKIRVLFVCLGNICRSPLGEIILRAMAFENGTLDLFEIDSAGTGGHHAGETPDERSVEVANLNLSKSISEKAYKHFKSIPLHRARQFRIEDFNKFDYIFAMDGSNLSHIKRMSSNVKGGHNAVVTRLGTYSSDKILDVEDPWYGNLSGFHICYNHVHDCLKNFYSQLEKNQFKIDS